MNILTNVNLNKNQVLNAVIHPLSADPASGALGQIYYNSSSKCLYQYDGTNWKKVGVVYNKTSSTGQVITGLNSANETVTGTDVVDLTLTGYTPIQDGVVTAGMTLESAFEALDQGVKEAKAGNQNAWSIFNIDGTTVSATAITDTFNFAKSGPITLSTSGKTMTIGITVDTAMNASSTNPVQNKVIKTAIDAAQSAAESYTDSELTKYLLINGSRSMTGNLNMKTGNTSYKITNLASPSDGTDAVNKSYVDNALTGYLKLDGTSTMTGDLKMGASGSYHKITGVAEDTNHDDNSVVINKQLDDFADDFNGQINALGERIGVVEEGLSTEISARIAADSALSSAIDSEISARQAAVSSLSDAIATESSARVAGDSALSGRIDAINSKISSSASPTNKLVSNSEMNEAIALVEAKQLYKTATQAQFASRAELLAATTFYNADGSIATPTKNDVAYVLADEDHDGKSAKYVIASLNSSGKPVWGFVLTFADIAFTDSQWDSINSTATASKIAAYEAHIVNTNNPHSVTKAQVGLGNVENKSVATIKSDLTGTIASGDTSFVTGGAAYTALNAKADKTTVEAIPIVKTVSGTINTTAKTANVSYTGTLINTFVKDASGEMVVVDIVVSASSVTFTTAQYPSSALTCTVVYI